MIKEINEKLSEGIEGEAKDKKEYEQELRNLIKK